MKVQDVKLNQLVWFYGTNSEGQTDRCERITARVIERPYKTMRRGRWAVVLAPIGWGTNRKTHDKAAFWPVRKVHTLRSPGARAQEEP